MLVLLHSKEADLITLVLELVHHLSRDEPDTGLNLLANRTPTSADFDPHATTEVATKHEVMLVILLSHVTQPTGGLRELPLRSLDVDAVVLVLGNADADVNVV